MRADKFLLQLNARPNCGLWITAVHVYGHLFYFIYLVKLSPVFDATSYGEIKIVISMGATVSAKQARVAV